MRRTIGWALALTLAQLTLGVSLGCYYNYTFFGRAAGPLPQPVSAGGAVFYYLLVAAGDTQTVQAWLWVACFAVAGWVWVGSLAAVSRAVAGSLPRHAVRASLLGVLPVCLPLPYLAWCHAMTPSGPTWRQFVDAALYRSFHDVPAGLTPLYLAMALVGLVLEARCLALANGWSGWRAAAILLGAGVLMAVILALLSAPFGLRA